ncbi:hypothetical protein QTO34_006711 [Cnephaeus nilssonii]|uniref:Xanthine dehydrogenase n=1 Tax=Cnephaeus nilssonii TaxID=3371016 RepID=A0AA40HL10_CNENI|nr:hypothetical protein QTO34_006711 [Eptesicus nilssonii]
MTADELVFFVNGKKVVEKNADPETTLLAYLRRKLGLSGTKLGCGEGGCGACTVMFSKYDRLQNKIIHFSANACLAPICSLHHVAVTTVEGIGSTKSRLHPVQERIAKSHGSQCGFCTPGIVMSMYTLLRNQPEPTMEEIEDAFQGNLCRCTGYRPILQGFRTFARVSGCPRTSVALLLKQQHPAITVGRDAKGLCITEKREKMARWQDGGCCGGNVDNPNCCMNQKKDHTVTPSPCLFNPEEFMPLDPTQEPIFPPELLRLKDAPRKQLRFEGERVTWIQASTLKELLDLKAQHPEAKLVVGNTEIGFEMKFKNRLFPVIICPAWIPELNLVERGPEGISFGAACPLDSVEKTLQDAVAELPAHKTEVFRGVLEQLRWLGGKQVKSVASIGGNIITASPISDLNPVFMASGAKLTIVSRGTRRTVPMDHTFFPGYRKTRLSPEEILLSIEIPIAGRASFSQHLSRPPGEKMT